MAPIDQNYRPDQYEVCVSISVNGRTVSGDLYDVTSIALATVGKVSAEPD